VTGLDIGSDRQEVSSFDRALGWLIGVAALTTALLLVVQVDRSADGARAQVRSAIVSSELTTGMGATAEVALFRLASSERAVLGGMAGTSRLMAGLEARDEGGLARAEAESAAAERLVTIAESMAAFPSQGGPLDTYAQAMLTMTGDELSALVAERTSLLEVQAPRVDRQGSLAVSALSLVALAAVLGGLAAALRHGRAGRLTLMAGFLVLAMAVALGVGAFL
jgi:hypothetical protein